MFRKIDDTSANVSPCRLGLQDDQASTQGAFSTTAFGLRKELFFRRSTEHVELEGQTLRLKAKVEGVEAQVSNS